MHRLNRKLSRACKSEVAEYCTGAYHGAQMDENNPHGFHCLYQVYREQQEKSDGDEDPPQVRTRPSCRHEKTSANSISLLSSIFPI